MGKERLFFENIKILWRHSLEVLVLNALVHVITIGSTHTLVYCELKLTKEIVYSMHFAGHIHHKAKKCT